MRSTSWKTVSTLVTMIVVAGCSESAVTTPSSSRLAPTSVLNAPEGRPVIDFGVTGPESNISASLLGGDLTADIVVSKEGGTYFIGGNAIYFPAKSICDPSTSGYGSGSWDKPCDVAKGNVKIHAVIHVAKAGTWIDFTPALRFVPSSNPEKWVWLYMSNDNVLGATDFSKFNINYAAKIGDPGVDESISDPTMRTYVDALSGVTLRRIKHFSGYQNSSGRSCDPNNDPDCKWVEDDVTGIGGGPNR